MPNNTNKVNKTIKKLIDVNKAFFKRSPNTTPIIDNKSAPPNKGRGFISVNRMIAKIIRQTNGINDDTIGKSTSPKIHFCDYKL